MVSAEMNVSGALLGVVAGNAVGTSIRVADELLIGRGAEGPGRLEADDEISRSHARVAIDSSGFCSIEDLGSTNGTFVNGQRISAPQTLSMGDTIELGHTTLVVRELPTPGREPAPGTMGQQSTVVPRRTPPPPEADLPPTDAIVTPTPPAEAPPDAIVTPAPPAAEEMGGASRARLTLRLEIDFVAREARVDFGDDSKPMRLVYVDGAWRTSTDPPIEEGGAR